MVPRQHLRERFWSTRENWKNSWRTLSAGRFAWRRSHCAIPTMRSTWCRMRCSSWRATMPAARAPNGGPCFYRILENGIRDLQRRRSVRKRFMAWLPGAKEDPDNEAQDPIDNVADAAPAIPETLMQAQAMQQLEVSLRALPARQREAFMLRNFEGLDVAGTATAMGCSQGSVKTHYSRAVHSLREQLGEVW